MSCNIIQFLKVLSHPERLRLTLDLMRAEQFVSELARHRGISTSTVSQHLARLRDSGVVIGSRRAQKMYYHVTDNCPVFELVEKLAELFTVGNRDTPHRLPSSQ
jgi:ArsR family transcriptional regulator